MIIIFGSANLDIVVQVDALPGPGETVSGGDRVLSPGGKGANQALSACRMGADVAFVGAVGDDDFGVQATALLRSDGVDLSHLRIVDRPTGIALIMVARSGENSIVVSPGANHQVTASALDAIPAGPADLLVLQCEIPTREILAAIAWAKRIGVRVLLNLAPVTAVPSETLADLEYLVVNETECAALAATLGLPSEAAHFAAAASEKFGLTVVVTLGAAGLAAHSEGRAVKLPAFPVDVVDTTGAGDAFVGALASGIVADLPLEDALRRASAAGAIACTALGAQQSLPRLNDVTQFLRAHQA